MRNLGNFRQAVESPKSWNSMGYICLKTTFLQLKHYIQKIYLTLLSTTFVRIHQIPYVIFETISHFSRYTTRPYNISSKTTYFWQKYPVKVQIFRFFITRVKIHQIYHVIFQTKSFSLNFGSLFSFMRDNSPVLFNSSVHDLVKRSLSKCKISDFQRVT